MSKSQAFLIFALWALLPVVAILSLEGCDRPSAGAQAEPGADTEESSKETPATLVQVGSFRRGEISETLRVYAKLEAVERADVYPEISVVVREILAREGDEVKKGQAIVQLVDRDRQLSTDVKKVLWDQAVTRVRQADLVSREQETIVRTKALLEEKAGYEFRRVTDLFGAGEESEGIISKEEFEAKRYALEEARIDHQTAIIQKDKSDAEFELAGQTRQQCELEYETARYQLSQTVLRSPIAGTVTFLELKPGELVSSAMKVFSVVNWEKLEARLFVPQKELSRLARGQRVEIECQVFPERKFDGRIEVVIPAVDEETGMVRVIVAVEDSNGFLKPGLFINGTVTLETRKDAVLVSKKAVIYETQQPVIFLVEDGVARRYVVQPGYDSREELEVLALEGRDGLRLEEIPADARVVTLGHNQLKDGSALELDPNQ